MKRIRRFFDAEWKIYSLWAIIWLINLLFNGTLLLIEIAKHDDIALRIITIVLDVIMIIASAVIVGIELGRDENIY